MKKWLILNVCGILLSQLCTAQNSITATYTTGDIPTSFNTFDPSCNGNNIILSVTLPAGESYTVTGMDISYSITALGGGQMAHQRSQVKCVNNNTTEATVYSGDGATPGSFAYNRTGVTIANGTYAGSTRLDFEMHAWRTVEVTPGCNTSVNRVNATSWVITVYYSNQNITPKVGVNTSMPGQSLQVNGKIQLGDDLVAPVAGTIRWNNSSNDFEGFDGTQWLSLTKKDATGGWGSGIATNENQGLTQAVDTGDIFGYSVSISGDFAIVGAFGKDVGANSNQGVAYIFSRNGNTWSLKATLTASDGAAGDEFGRSVSISGDYAIVGAYRKDVGANSNQGKAYIYNHVSGFWFQQAILTANNGAAFDEFGTSVSISGDYAIVGADGKDFGAVAGQGSAYIFNRSGTSWNQQAILNATDGAAGDLFGFSVSLSGNYAIVGAYRKDIGVNSDQGRAYIFSRSGIAWNQQAMLIAADGAFSDYFGYRVCISGDYAIVGAWNKDVGVNSSQGKAYIFNRIGNIWTQQDMLTINDGAANDWFGASVCIDGDYAIVGATGKDAGTNNGQGKAYVFSRTGTTWNQQVVLNPSDGATLDFFSRGVSISGNHIIIGASEKDIQSGSTLYTGAGKVYFFTRQ